MGEITINYEQKYKSALEWMRGIYPTMQGCEKEDAEHYFPELRESEDERIKRCIQVALTDVDEKRFNDYDTTLKDCLFWLEKQGEQKPTPKFKIGDIIHKIGENTVFPRTIEKIEDGDYVCNNSHLFVNIKFQDDYELVEQKPANKIESKFNIGDWITNGEYTWKVTDIKPLDYILQSPNGDVVDDTISYVDECFRLWTIQDAKDGDVLSFDNECSNYHSIGIFKRMASKNELNGNTYRCYVKYGGFEEKLEIPKNGNELHHCGTSAHPATKEQRDLLFLNMKEAGYEWDAEKKELKKSLFGESKYDLFFADEVEELTEFEKELNRIVIAFSDAHAYMDKNEIHHYSKGLLDLARKELFKEQEHCVIIPEEDYYEQLASQYHIGQEDAFKSLPKWKKMPNGIQGNGDFNPTYLVRVSNGYYFTTPCLSWDKDSMYIELAELDKLPKEE